MSVNSPREKERHRSDKSLLRWNWTTSEFKDLKMVKAADVVKDPSLVDGLEGKFRTLWDTWRFGPVPYENLEKAMNIMATRGWVPITMSQREAALFVIMEKKE